MGLLNRQDLEPQLRQEGLHLELGQRPRAKVEGQVEGLPLLFPHPVCTEFCQTCQVLLDGSDPEVWDFLSIQSVGERYSSGVLSGFHFPISASCSLRIQISERRKRPVALHADTVPSWRAASCSEMSRKSSFVDRIREGVPSVSKLGNFEDLMFLSVWKTAEVRQATTFHEAGSSACITRPFSCCMIRYLLWVEVPLGEGFEK